MAANRRHAPRHAYDAQTLSQAWETLLLNQFHDTLPGSCIGKVYEDAKEQFSSIYAATDRLIAQAGDYLWGRGTQELVYNDLPFVRSDTVLLPHGKAVAGRPWQTTQEGNLCLVSDVPALGWRTIETCDAPTRLLRRGRTRRLRPALCESSWTARGPSRGSTISA